MHVFLFVHCDILYGTATKIGLKTDYFFSKRIKRFAKKNIKLIISSFERKIYVLLNRNKMYDTLPAVKGVKPEASC